DGATAMGDGLEAALDAIEAVDVLPGQAQPGQQHPPAVTLLLSDGANTTGRDPQEQAERARRLDVPVFTIALGPPGGRMRGPATTAGWEAAGDLRVAAPAVADPAGAGGAGPAAVERAAPPAPGGRVRQPGAAPQHGDRPAGLAQLAPGRLLPAGGHGAAGRAR